MKLGDYVQISTTVSDLAVALAFYEKLGFGLHQTTDFAGPHITYFAGDMAERIEKLEADGITMTAVPPEVDGKVANAVFTAPGGQKIFLFHGEI